MADSKRLDDWREKHHGPATRKQLRPDLKGTPPETISGLPLQPIYFASDVDEKRLDAESFPGTPPFTRGIHPGMYRSRFWTVRQYSGFSSAAETNARWKKLLAGGGTGLSTAFDLPTQLGLDPDDPRSLGEVGRVGVPIASVEDMHRLFEGIDVGAVSVSMTINAPAPVLLAFLQIVAEERGVPLENVRGTVQNDILKEFAARNNYIFPPGPSMDLAVDVIEHCAKVLTGFYPISVSGYHLREAGCTAQQEIAFTLANGLAYLAAAAARGINPQDVGRQLSFFFCATTELLEEVAKFRAARRLWAALMQERFGVTDDKARQLRFHCQTAGSLLTSQQPENNLVRVAIQALSAVLGGCQSLHTNSFDEAIGLPGELSAQLALATQNILAYETGVANVVDPCGGSYAIEAMTDRLETEARALIKEIDALGGAVPAIAAGLYQRRIADAAFRYQRQVEEGTRKIIGVNIITEGVKRDEEGSIQTLRPEMELEARDSIAALRQRRDSARSKAALGAVEAAARANAGRMDAIVNAARARCTVGEICGALRRVYGEQK